MNGFFLALQFLTTLPVPYEVHFNDRAQAVSLIYYPLVGLLIGSLLWLITLLPGHEVLKAALLVVFWVAVTGALHLDGLADVADAWAGGLGDRDRTLEIMKDPASGPMGVSAIGVVVLLKFAALLELLQSEIIWLVLLPPVLGRAAVLVMLLTTRYVREGGIATAMERHLPVRAVRVVLSLVAVSIVLLPGYAPLAVAVMLALLLTGLRRAFVQRLGGITGDVLGAVVVITEVAVLVTLVWFAT